MRHKCIPSLDIQVAAQQGAYLSKCLNRRLQCEENPEGPLRFRDSGRHRFRPFRYAIYFKMLIYLSLICGSSTICSYTIIFYEISCKKREKEYTLMLRLDVRI